MIPTTIRANFDFTFTVEDKAADVPTGYTPKFVLSGASSVIKSGTTSGDDLSFTFVAADTATFPTGQYWYQVIATNGSGGRKFITEGSVFVEGAIAGTGTYDGRSVAKKILDAIDATIQGKATKDQQSYVIQSGSGSRSLSGVSMTDLMEARKYYAAIVAAELRANSQVPLFKRHKFGFVCD